MLNEFTQIWGRSSQKIHYISYVYFPYFFSNPTSQMIFPHNKNPRWLGHFSRFPLVGRLNGLVFLGKNYRKTPSKKWENLWFPVKIFSTKPIHFVEHVRAAFCRQVMTLDTFLGEVGRRPSLFQTIVDLRRRRGW